MANHYLKATGNWSAAATWSDTDGGAAGAAAPIAGDSVFFTANGNGLTCTIDAASACGSILASGGCTATLAGTQTITVSGNVTLLATMTIPNTITWTITGTGNFAGSTLATLGAINLNGTAHTVSDAFTCTVLTRNGTATKTDSITFTSGTTVTCTTCAMIGNSAINRLLVQSSTLGTAATITTTNWTGTLNADIMDIIATNAVDFQALGIVTGDCGGNTGVTFTTAVAQTYTDAGDHLWSTAANWTSRVPLPQDDVTCAATVTVDMPRIGKSITFTGTPTVSFANTFTLYGSLTIPTGATWTHNNKISHFMGRGVYTLTSNGKTMFQIYLEAPTGTLTLQDNLTLDGELRLYNGILNFNTANVSVLYASMQGTATKSWLLGTGVFTINGTAAVDKLDFSATVGSTLNAGTSTIVLTNSTANTQGFAGGGFIYNNVTVAGAGNYALTITGNNTFNTFTVDAQVAAKTITGTVASIQTIRRLIRLGNNKNVITLNSTGAAWTIQGNTGYFEGDYLALTNVVATNKYLYYAGDHSTDSGGNTNWLFKRKVRQFMFPRR